MTILSRLPLTVAVGFALFRSKGSRRVSVATLVSLGGIAIGVATLAGVVAVTEGFRVAFRNHILGVFPHIVIIERGGEFTGYTEVANKVESVDGVVAAIPSTYDEMMASSDTASKGVVVKGMDFWGTELERHLRELTRVGVLDELRPRHEGMQRVFLGCRLMRRLKVAAGQVITLTTPVRGVGSGPGPLGMAPMEQDFHVAGCLDTGFYEYDSKLVLMDLRVALSFLNRGDMVRWVEVRTRRVFDTERSILGIFRVLQPLTIFDLLEQIPRVEEAGREVLRRALQEREQMDVPTLIEAADDLERSLTYSDIGLWTERRFKVIDWKTMNRNMFAALKTQKVVLALFFLIIVLVAAFNIIGTQVVVARERVKEISTLVALGASRMRLYALFVVHGLMLGTVGVGLGIALGAVAAAAIRAVRFPLDPTVYHIATLPAAFTVTDVLYIGGLSLGVVLLSCLASAARAIRLDPAEGLRKIA